MITATTSKPIVAKAVIASYVTIVSPPFVESNRPPLLAALDLLYHNLTARTSVLAFLYGIFPFSVVYCTEQMSMLHETIDYEKFYNSGVPKGLFTGQNGATCCTNYLKIRFYTT